LLGDLLMQLLGDHDQPRLAKELRDELMEKHPDRTPTPQVVRNTLESLVAKGRIRRHRQQRSVMYSLVQSAQPAAAKS
jgi:Fe2+ or Zn2+ uptake regulation protein